MGARNTLLTAYERVEISVFRFRDPVKLKRVLLFNR